MRLEWVQSLVGELRPLMLHLCCSIAQSCLTLCNHVDCSMSGFPVLNCLLEFAQTHVHRFGDAIQSSHPLSPHLLLPSVFISIRVFFNELTLQIRWPKYWSFSFRISPSNEYSGLIYFRIYWFDLLVVEGILKTFPAPRSVQFSRTVVSDSLQPNGLQHTRLPCPLQTPGAYTNSCPLSRWCHPTNLSLCCPITLPPSIFPSIRVFSNRLVLCIRWLKYWSFSFNISPSNEYSGLISFTIDWLDPLSVQGTLKSLLQHHSSTASIT